MHWGFINNPKFGITKAHFVTQVELSTENPSFGGYDPVIDSVYLYVPYFSTLESTETSGERIYELIQFMEILKQENLNYQF